MKELKLSARRNKDMRMNIKKFERDFKINTRKKDIYKEIKDYGKYKKREGKIEYLLYQYYCTEDVKYFEGFDVEDVNMVINILYDDPDRLAHRLYLIALSIDRDNYPLFELETAIKAIIHLRRVQNKMIDDEDIYKEICDENILEYIIMNELSNKELEKLIKTYDFTNEDLKYMSDFFDEYKDDDKDYKRYYNVLQKFLM